MTDERAEPEAPASPGPSSKRSQTVSLVLVAGAAATALGLGHLDPSRENEDVLVYPAPEACVAEAVRTAQECNDEYALARAAYPTAAPRYDALGSCEGHHGAGHCVAGDTVTPDAAGRSLPRMAGFLIGRRPEQEVTPQPVFEHQPTGDGHGGYVGHGGYCTGSGARVLAGAGGRASRGHVASSAIGRTAFGGFGGTGRGFSAHGSSGGG